MSFGSNVLKFYDELEFPTEDLPSGTEIMVPFRDPDIRNINRIFYDKYYNDNKKRIFLIGINPGRFGGGITGIPFTDPINLTKVLRIDNNLTQRHELSSRFIYKVVEAMGGPHDFFSKCYLTALSPLGFIRDKKNINYYDDKQITEAFSEKFIQWLVMQAEFGADNRVAFSLGQGKNYTFLKKLNSGIRLFDRIQPLPHPRWVMQYRYRQREVYVRQYLTEISNYF